MNLRFTRKSGDTSAFIDFPMDAIRDYEETVKQAFMSGIQLAAQDMRQYIREQLNEAYEGVSSDPWDYPFKRTGSLQDCIKILQSNTGDAAALYIDEEEAPYWRYLEYGTSKMEPRPFWRRSLAKIEPRAKAVMWQEVLRFMRSGYRVASQPSRSSPSSGGGQARSKSYRKR